MKTILALTIGLSFLNYLQVQAAQTLNLNRPRSRARRGQAASLSLADILPRTPANPSKRSSSRRQAKIQTPMSELDKLKQGFQDPNILKFLEDEVGFDLTKFSNEQGQAPPMTELVVNRPSHKKVECGSKGAEDRRNSAIYKSNCLSLGTSAKQFPEPEEAEVKQAGCKYTKITVNSFEIPISNAKQSLSGAVACLFPPKSAGTWRLTRHSPSFRVLPSLF